MGQRSWCLTEKEKEYTAERTEEHEGLIGRLHVDLVALFYLIEIVMINEHEPEIHFDLELLKMCETLCCALIQMNPEHVFVLKCIETCWFL